MPQPESQPLSQPQGAATSQPHAGAEAQPPQGASQPQAGSAAHPQGAATSQPQAGAAQHPLSHPQPLCLPKSLSQQATLHAATGVTAVVATTRICNFAAACRCSASAARGFAATSWFNGATTTRCFAATRWCSCTAAVTTAITEFVKKAERFGVSRAASNHRDCQQRRNDYTTHRGVSMDESIGKVLANAFTAIHPSG